MAAARAKMIARRFGGKDVSKTGGKGSMRRKKKTVHKTAQSDDKRIGATLRVEARRHDIPGIEEVNVLKRRLVVHFKHNVKLQAHGREHVRDHGQARREVDPGPHAGILPHLGPELAQQLQGAWAWAVGGGMRAPPPSDELGLPSDSDDSDEGSDSEDDVRRARLRTSDEAQK